MAMREQHSIVPCSFRTSFNLNFPSLHANPERSTEKFVLFSHRTLQTIKPCLVWFRSPFLIGIWVIWHTFFKENYTTWQTGIKIIALSSWHIANEAKNSENSNFNSLCMSYHVRRFPWLLLSKKSQMLNVISIIVIKFINLILAFMWTRYVIRRCIEIFLNRFRLYWNFYFYMKYLSLLFEISIHEVIQFNQFLYLKIFMFFNDLSYFMYVYVNFSIKFLEYFLSF